MRNAFEEQVEHVIQCRQQLDEVEARRGQYEQNVPTEIWQALAEVSLRLEQAEEKVRQICRELAGEVNQARLEIVSTLEQYNAWREQMRRVEDSFLANILRPGHHLKQAIRQREHLEGEYRRILAGIQREAYPSQQELEADIRLVLGQDEATSGTEAEDVDEEELQDEDLLGKLEEATVEDVVEAISREELVKEFKRVVLPKVHPDTSNTPVEVFKTVYEVYKKRDPLLMEAYIVEYRGEIQPDQEADPLDSLNQMQKSRERILRLFARLQRRVDRLKQDLTAQEKQDPGSVQENLQQQRQEILARIQSEAEQILHWRDKIEGLVKKYLEYHGHGEAG
jgi:hypothetical protein